MVRALIYQLSGVAAIGIRFQVCWQSEHPRQSRLGVPCQCKCIKRTSRSLRQRNTWTRYSSHNSQSIWREREREIRSYFCANIHSLTTAANQESGRLTSFASFRIKSAFYLPFASKSKFELRPQFEGSLAVGTRLMM